MNVDYWFWSLVYKLDTTVSWLCDTYIILVDLVDMTYELTWLEIILNKYM